MAPTAMRLPAVLDNLDEFRAFVTERAQAMDVDPARMLKLELVLEEILVNVISYAYPNGDGDVEVGLASPKPGGFVLSIRDWGQPFNPLEKDAPDLEADIDARGIGGLGIHFVRQSADDVDYAREDESNVLRITFAPPGD